MWPAQWRGFCGLAAAAGGATSAAAAAVYFALPATAGTDSTCNRAFEGGLVYVVTSGPFRAVG